MKKIILFISLISITAVSYAQGFRKIPATVTEAFKVQYPDATNVSWKDKTTGFEAGYDWQGKKMYSKFNGKGEWLRTETILHFSELNPEVQVGLQKSKYQDWPVTEVRKLDTHKNKTYFVIEVKKMPFQKKNLYFNEKGELQRDPLSI